MKKIFKPILNAPKHLLIALIELYQAILSPDHSWLKHKFPYGYCRHYPSCSQYSKQAIIKFGAFKGLWLSIKRLLRCNPWAESKFDSLPKV